VARARISTAFGFAAILLPGCGQPTGPQTPIEGQRIYEQYCARCHGSDGRGIPGATELEPTTPEHLAALKPLADPARMRTVSDEAILGVIRSGRPPVMPGFAGEFTEAKLMVLAAYVRSLSGTAGSRTAK
jgi:mono/diheme cytochrome c family protein